MRVQTGITLTCMRRRGQLRMFVSDEALVLLRQLPSADDMAAAKSARQTGKEKALPIKLPMAAGDIETRMLDTSKP